MLFSSAYPQYIYFIEHEIKKFLFLFCEKHKLLVPLFSFLFMNLLIGLFLDWIILETNNYWVLWRMWGGSSRTDAPFLFSYSVMDSLHYSSAVDQIVPLRCHFRFLSQMLFSERKKDLGNEQKSMHFHAFFPQTLFYDIIWKKKRGIFFFNILKKSEVLLYWLLWVASRFLFK